MKLLAINEFFNTKSDANDVAKRIMSDLGAKDYSLDIKELDGATKRRIDDIRSLIDGAYYSPQELKKKIYIIDECHQLTPEATSALLKILEEPPPYLTFILCTTEIKKILPTILSRCQRFNFHRIHSTMIAKRLKFIAENEHIDIDDAAISAISKISRGIMRDAVGYLEQIGTLASGTGKKITLEHVQKYFGAADRLGIFNIVKAILNKDVPKLLDQVNDMIMASADAKEIMFEVSEVFRNIMVLKVPKVNQKLVDLPDNEVDELKGLSKALDINQLFKLSHIFSEIGHKIDININDRWIMEATLIGCVKVVAEKTK